MPDSPPPTARVLFVEAHDDSRDVFTVAFAHAGFDVRAFATAGAALAASDRARPDVAVACPPLPDASGGDFGRRLRRHEATRRAALIALAVDTRGRDGLERSFDLVLTKPVDCERLVAAVGRLAARGASRGTPPPAPTGPRGPNAP